MRERDTMKFLKDFVYDSRWVILASLACFAFGIAFGAASYGRVIDKLLPVIEETFRDIMIDGNDLQTVANILVRNVWASTVVMIFGVFIAPTLLILFSNGFIVGIVARLALERGAGLHKIFFGVVPHGIFEIPAILFASSAGMRVGLSAIFPGGKSRINAVSDRIKEAMAAYFTIVLPLLVIAAFVEVFVSKRMIQ
ncbi:MAG: stage II sporulation protein M [Candidatus Altiarchaeota archaeon]|nr:stage II sporulation protein M [Candidatus Altiarchaeota archaeon]